MFTQYFDVNVLEKFNSKQVALQMGHESANLTARV